MFKSTPLIDIEVFKKGIKMKRDKHCFNLKSVLQLFHFTKKWFNSSVIAQNPLEIQTTKHCCFIYCRECTPQGIDGR